MSHIFRYAKSQNIDAADVRDILADLQSCSSFESLTEYCRAMKQSPPQPDFHRNFTNVRLDSDVMCPYSLARISFDVPFAEPFPIRTSPDGSCLLHAASRLLFGTQMNDMLLRILIVFEGVLNMDYYLNDQEMGCGIDFNDSMFSSVTNFYATLSQSFGSSKKGHLLPTSIRETFEKEMLRY